MFSSFSAELPWTTCNNEWNTPGCTLHFDAASEAVQNVSAVVNSTVEGLTTTVAVAVNATKHISMDPTTEYWE